MRRYFLIAPIAAVLAFASGSVFAQNGGDNTNIYSAMDDNGDGVVSESEFSEYYDESDIFEVWDVNNDGWVSEEEFADGLYDYYDDNEDGYIDEGELEMSDDPDEEGFWDF